MATKTARKNGDSTANLGFEAKLWLTAVKLRDNMDVAEYKHVVLGLIFLKYISDNRVGRETLNKSVGRESRSCKMFNRKVSSFESSNSRDLFSVFLVACSCAQVVVGLFGLVNDVQTLRMALWLSSKGIEAAPLGLA